MAILMKKDLTLSRFKSHFQPLDPTKPYLQNDEYLTIEVGSVQTLASGEEEYSGEEEPKPQIGFVRQEKKEEKKSIGFNPSPKEP
jgi:hypothetical protein